MTLREYLGTMTEPELRAGLEILAASSPAVVAQALAQAVKGQRCPGQARHSGRGHLIALRHYPG
jgi:hypothetical protein